MKIEAFRPDGDAPRYYGVYPAIVTDITRDSDSLGRIELKFPWLGGDGNDVRSLATLCTPYADDDQGFEMIPAKDSQVVVAFEAGVLTRPYIIGACWNGKEKLPQNPEAANNKRLIKTREGSLLEFDDTDGAAEDHALDAERPHVRARRRSAGSQAARTRADPSSRSTRRDR